LSLLLGFVPLVAASPGFTAVPDDEGRIFKGKVIDADTGDPLPGAVVQLEALWAVSAEDGTFAISSITPGRYNLKVTLLGYADYSLALNIMKNVERFDVKLEEQSLALDGVTVTASKSKDGTGTTHNIGRDALNHLQISNMSDMSSLLPGGKTHNPDLTSSSTFDIRAGGSSQGNSSFSTAVEVDGVRVGGNGGFGELGGTDTRNISVDNVDHVEVISGVPSAEYGDLGSGIVKIHTKTGKTPFNISFAVNPRSYQTSVTKGVGLGKDGGVLNVSAEWANSTKKLVSPYESYTRRSLSFKYSNTFAKKLRFEAGLTGNLGGMNSENDPDAYSGEYSHVRDNVLRANTSLDWQINRPGITSLKLEGSVNFNDKLSKYHEYHSTASTQPAVHSELLGYSLAERLPVTYFSDKIIDSKELDYAAALKYTWAERFGKSSSKLKAGIQWKAEGNAGEGEYYENPSLAANGYRPRPYRTYPFMHNISAYLEEDFTFPFGLELSAGIRLENVLVQGSSYKNVSSLTPRFNARLPLGKKVVLRGGWGMAEKLPSFHILYPVQEYRDIQTFAFSHLDQSSYVYYTIPYAIEYNPELKWQRHKNAEFGIDFYPGDFQISLVGFCNITENPYRLISSYNPFTYRISSIPEGYTVPDNPQVKVDNQTGEVYMRGSSDIVWTQMNTKVLDQTFVKTTKQSNGKPVTRAGAELNVEFPQINPIKTKFKLDAAYSYTDYKDTGRSYYYNNGWSHTSLSNRSYQYVGIYENGSNTTQTSCGEFTHSLDANLTSITHIPEAKLVITCRLEMSVFSRSMRYPAGQRDRLLPVAYMTLDGQEHQFTAEDASNPEFTNLILYPSNDYLFDMDGYGTYASANLSITKEIGKHVSLSFFANNFTNSRPVVYSMATGVGAVFTPAFYYGLTCRIKL